MARIRSDLQIEKGLPAGNKVLAKPDGQTEVVQIEPYRVSPTTWIVDEASIYENVPGQFEIPSLPYAKDIDTVFSKGGRVFLYNAGGSYFELVYSSEGQVIEPTENDIATFAANSGNYTFSSGDIIAIDDGMGAYNLYLYNGSTKTDTNSYLPLNVSQIDWSQITNTPTTLGGYGITDAATAVQGTKADSAVQPGDNLSELNDDTDFITDVIAGGNITIDKTNPKEPVFHGLSAAIPEYGSKSAASGDLNLGLNYPYSIEGDDTAYVKKDTGFISTWDTTQSGVSASDEIALPLAAAGTYNFDVWYGGQLIKTITTYTDNIITFPDGSGTKQIVCVGQLEGFRFANGGDKYKILSVESFGSGFGGTDFSQMFQGCTNLTEVGILDTAGVTSMTQMFYLCTSLTTLDVSAWDVSSVTNMSHMFFQCTSLTTLDVSGWDVSSVTNMTTTFYLCTSLTTLDVSGWDVSSVVNMGQMFRQCTSLTTLDVSAWDVSSVINMSQMFRQCTLTSLAFQNWNISKVADMTEMFLGTNFANTANYTAALQYWSTLPLQSGVTPNFGAMKYDASAAAARAYIISQYGWTITDGGPSGN